MDTLHTWRQHPEVKINHGLVLGSNEQGIGKDTILEGPRRAVGDWNFKEVAPKNMFDDFNPWRRAVILLTDGEDTASLVSDEQVLELARKTEINIYAISLRPNRAQDRQRQAFSQAEYLLTALSRDTGGRVFFPNSLSELDSVYERIAEELRTQYSLGYVSSNRRKDGKWRRIVVRIPSRDELTVRHKLGYYAPAT
jgi:Ca-activated chloride channel family protein